MIRLLVAVTLLAPAPGIMEKKPHAGADFLTPRPLKPKSFRQGGLPPGGGWHKSNGNYGHITWRNDASRKTQFYIPRNRYSVFCDDPDCPNCYRQTYFTQKE